MTPIYRPAEILYRQWSVVALAIKHYYAPKGCLPELSTSFGFELSAAPPTLAEGFDESGGGADIADKSGNINFGAEPLAATAVSATEKEGALSRWIAASISHSS